MFSITAWPGAGGGESVRTAGGRRGGGNASPACSEWENGALCLQLRARLSELETELGLLFRTWKTY